MSKIIILEDDQLNFELLLSEILESTDFNVEDIKPGIYVDTFNFIQIDKDLKQENYESSFTLFQDLYKAISNENRNQIFNELFKCLEFNKANFIILDIALKGKTDSEGLHFYNFLLCNKIDANKILITSVTDIQNANTQLKELFPNLDLIETNYYLKEGSGSYTKDVIKKLKLENVN